LEEKDRERVKAARDVQFDRAMDLLKGITLYTHRASTGDQATKKAAEKVAVK
jgi:hypothetical protein